MENFENNPDAPLALREAKRLQKDLEAQCFYRFRNCLYDPWFYKPRYTIKEYAWAFCKEPSLAYMTAHYLDELLEDIPSTKEMTKTEMIAGCKHYLDEFTKVADANPENRTKRAVAVSRVIRFSGQKEFLRDVALPDRKVRGERSLYDTMKRKLLDIYIENHWQPGWEFYQRIFKREK